MRTHDFCTAEPRYESRVMVNPVQSPDEVVYDGWDVASAAPPSDDPRVRFHVGDPVEAGRDAVVDDHPPAAPRPAPSGSAR